MSDTMITVFVILFHPYFSFLLITPHLAFRNNILYTTGHENDKDVKFMDVKSSTLLQAWDYFTLILEYELL